jgi:hypothetical protein
MAADQKELRQLTPTHLLNFYEAAAVARDMERTDLINRVLTEWAEREAHKANVLLRLLDGNPLLSEPRRRKTTEGSL